MDLWIRCYIWELVVRGRVGRMSRKDKEIGRWQRAAPSGLCTEAKYSGVRIREALGLTKLFMKDYESPKTQIKWWMSPAQDMVVWSWSGGAYLASVWN